MEVIGQRHALAVESPKKENPGPTEQETGWAPPRVKTLWKREKLWTLKFRFICGTELRDSSMAVFLSSCF